MLRLAFTGFFINFELKSGCLQRHKNVAPSAAGERCACFLFTGVGRPGMVLHSTLRTDGILSFS